MCARRAAWHGSTVACRTMGNNKYTLTTCYSIASAIMWKLAIIGPGVRGSLLIGARECHRSRRFYCPHLNNDRNMSSKKVEEKESGHVLFHPWTPAFLLFAAAVAHCPHVVIFLFQHLPQRLIMYSPIVCSCGL